MPPRPAAAGLADGPRGKCNTASSAIKRFISLQLAALRRGCPCCRLTRPQLRRLTACSCCHARQPLALQTGRAASAPPLHPQFNALFRCNLPRCAAGARAGAAHHVRWSCSAASASPGTGGAPPALPPDVVRRSSCHATHLMPAPRRSTAAAPPRRRRRRRRGAVDRTPRDFNPHLTLI